MAEDLKLEEYKEIDNDKMSYFRDKAQEYASKGLHAAKETGSKLYTYLRENTKAKPISAERKAEIDRRNKEIEEAQHQRKVRAIQEAPIEIQVPIKRKGNFLSTLGQTNPLNKKDDMGLGTGSGNMNIGDSFSVNSKFFEFNSIQSKTPDFGIKMGNPVNPMGNSKKKSKKGKSKKETFDIKQFGGF